MKFIDDIIQSCSHQILCLVSNSYPSICCLTSLVFSGCIPIFVPTYLIQLLTFTYIHESPHQNLFPLFHFSWDPDRFNSHASDSLCRPSTEPSGRSGAKYFCSISFHSSSFGYSKPGWKQQHANPHPGHRAPLPEKKKKKWEMASGSGNPTSHLEIPRSS